MAPRALTFALYRHDQLVRRTTLSGAVLGIGRADDAQLHIDDPDVSRAHAVLEVRDRPTLIDLGSEGGTFVNDQRIDRRVLLAGDRVRVGSTTIVLEDEDAPGGAAVTLPSPERVRAELGDAFAPDKFFGVAALVMHIDGVRRRAWNDDVELSQRLFQSFPRDAVPAADLGPERSYKVLDDTIPTRARRCSDCVIRPGEAPCALCLGSGAGSHGDRYLDPCAACRGLGFLRCETCEGTTQVVACSVRYVNDAPVRVRRAIVPAVEQELRPLLEAAIDPVAAWPSGLAYDPEPSFVGTAYRGATALRATPDFHGFFFGDAIARYLAAREQASSGLARFVERAFAVPVLWTVTGERHEAFFFDASGTLRRVPPS